MTGGAGNQRGACTFVDTGKLNICLDLQVSPGAIPFFEEAKDLWESVNTGDVGPSSTQRFYNLPSSAATDDMTFINLKPTFVDDLYVSAIEMQMDGVGGVLGLAAPTFVTSAENRPIAGFTQFDSADIASLLRSNQRLLRNTITHEIGHVHGIGTAVSIVCSWCPGESLRLSCSLLSVGIFKPKSF